MSRTLLKARVVAYARLDRLAGDGFVLPLLRVGGQANWFTQQADEITGCITLFRMLDDIALEQWEIPNPIVVRVGDPQVYVFINGSTILVGTSVDIEPALREFVRQNPSSVAARLQIYQIIGSPAERRVARSAMRSAIESNMGEAAATSFYKSSLESAFWIKLVSAWKLTENPDRREELRSAFRVSLENDGKIHIEDLYPADENENRLLTGIISDLKLEFEVSGSTLSPVGLLPSKSIDDRLRVIGYTARQEERIARLLAGILEDHGTGMSVLRSYMPRALFERRAVAHAIELFGENSENYSESDTVISKLIFNLFSYCFPMNRGYLLYFLAKHLAIYPKVNRAIEQKLKATNSMFVREHAGAIMASLRTHR
jgi:hypothetical protein